MTEPNEMSPMPAGAPSIPSSSNDTSPGGDTAAGRLMRLIAELAASHPEEHIRLMPLGATAGSAEGTFLLQVDDFSLHLELLGVPSGRPEMAPGDLPRLATILKENPNVHALVLVWDAADLPALCLTPAGLQSLRDRGATLTPLTAAQSLPDLLRHLLAERFRRWDSGGDQPACGAPTPTDLRTLFERAIGAGIEAERSRRYQHAERRQAAKTFPVEREKRVIFSALRDALNGARAADLAAALVRVEPGDEP